MSIISVLTIVVLVIWVYATLLFAVSIVIKRNDIADIAWGPGIALVGLTALLSTGVQDTTTLILFGLIVVWAFRLAVRVGARVLSHKEEDPRYKAWRDEWTWFYTRSYAQVYLLQGFLMIPLGYPIVHMAVYGAPIVGVLLYAGIAVWLIGFMFEVVGDWQLARFLKNPENKGKVIQQGLWKYSRHPNYFGEVTLWWGIWIALIGVPYFYLALISPLVITFLILKVSGIPMLEKLMEKNPNWEEYKRKTSVFIPLPPKK
jgi:steroid 5-alpha reductase family enzyme